MPINQEMLKVAQENATKEAADPRMMMDVGGGPPTGPTPIGDNYLSGMQNVGNNINRTSQMMGAAAPFVGRTMGKALGGPLAGALGGAAGSLLGQQARHSGANAAVEFGSRSPVSRVPLGVSNGRLTNRPDPASVRGFFSTQRIGQQFRRHEEDLNNMRQNFQELQKTNAAKEAADSWQQVNLAKNPINWSRVLPKADATAKDWKSAGGGWMGSALPNKSPTAPAAAPAMKPMPGAMKKSAFAFGQKAAAGLGDFNLSSLQKYLPGAGLGAGAGALVGGLGGLMFPGRRRGRLGGALRGALAGAGLGGLAGGAAGGGMFGQQAQNMMGQAQGAMSDVYKRLGEFYTDKFNPKSRLKFKSQTPEEVASAAGEEPMGDFSQDQAPVSHQTFADNRDRARMDYALRNLGTEQKPPRLNPTVMSPETRDAYGEEPLGE